MNSREQARFRPLFEKMQRALKLEGKAKATEDAYSRAVRRAAERFERCPDDLSAEELREHFAELLESHSWSTVKLDRCGLQVFYRHVLDRPWDWVDIVKPPQAQRFPYVLTRAETHRLLGSLYKLRPQIAAVFFDNTKSAAVSASAFSLCCRSRCSVRTCCRIRRERQWVRLF